jgi:O-antigen/teichoic acid export membrane protein
MRGRRLRGEVLITFAFAVLKAIAVVWSIRLADAIYPAALLGLYLLSRRVASTLPNLTALGVSNTLQRYIPLNRDDAKVNAAFIAASALIVSSLSGLVLVVFVASGHAGVRLLFPNAAANADLNALAVWTVAQCALVALHFVVLGSLIGRRQMFVAGLLDLLVVGMWQVLAFAIYGSRATPVSVVRFQAVAMLFTTVPLVVFLLLSELQRAGRRWVVPTRDTWRTLMIYGSTRGGVTFLDSLLVTLGPWLLRGTPDAMGHLIIALTLIRVASTALGSLNSATSVAVANLLGRGDEHAIRTGVNLMIGFVTIPAVLGAAVVAPFSEVIVRTWLRSGTAIETIAGTAVWLLAALPAVALFHGLKGIVDVQEIFPYNLVNLVFSNLVLGATFYIAVSHLAPLSAAVVALVIAHIVLATGTLIALRRWLMPLRYFGFGRLAMAGTAAWGVCHMAADSLRAVAGLRALILAVGVMAATFGLGVAALLIVRRTDFFQDLSALVLRGKLPVVVE